MRQHNAKRDVVVRADTWIPTCVLCRLSRDTSLIPRSRRARRAHGVERWPRRLQNMMTGRRTRPATAMMPQPIRLLVGVGLTRTSAVSAHRVAYNRREVSVFSMSRGCRNVLGLALVAFSTSCRITDACSKELTYD